MSEESRGERCEFVPDIARIGRVGFRLIAVQHSTKRTGQSRMLDALELDVAEGEKTGLDFVAMAHEAYMDIFKDRQS